ncbi:DUF4376 domain-containing protein [Falsihalocynthiibacter sp. BN13B15]|uniref:DUF4376 domain-containing protein n=1 Tax=Falsihalocynthiibacter sp. BN13B15 TaxID=3240871 RepID=UPI0035102A7C
MLEIKRTVESKAYQKAAENREIMDAINLERDRRINLGFDFAGQHFQSDPKSLLNISGAGASAGIAYISGKQAGDYRWHGGDSDFAWTVGDNTSFVMDAQTTFAMSQAAMAHVDWFMKASRALKDMDPIPSDFLDDQYW